MLGALFWRRPIDLQTPVCSPAALAGLAVYLAAAPRRCSLTACGVPPRRARVGLATPATKNPTGKIGGVFTLATSYSRTAYRRTTIGAAAFHFRVRNGNGWDHCVIVTRAEKRLRCSALVAAVRAA